MLRRIWAALFLILLVSFLRPDVAAADHSVRFGIGSCDGDRTATVPPGDSIEVVACLARGGSPLADHLIAFVETGPSPLDAYESRTDAEGSARTIISSPVEGVSRVGVCDSQQCFEPLTITWWDGTGATPEPPRTLPPEVLPDAAAEPLKPRLDLATFPSGTGFSCLGQDSRQVPAAISIESFDRTEITHPVTGEETEAVRVNTGQSILSGSAIYGQPLVLYLSMRSFGGPVDESGPYPLRGFDRQLLVWTIDGALWGKHEFVYEGSWRERAAGFTAVISHNETTFVLDAGRFPNDVAIGTRMSGLCDGVGLTFAGPEQEPERTGATVAAGIGLLLLIAALTSAILRATEPPSGISADLPGSPVVRFQRSDIRFDDFARPVGYTDILELPDGSIRTVRTRIHQEQLLVRDIDFLDVMDTEDPVFEVEREDFVFDSDGRLIGYVETTTLSDGSTYRAEIKDIRYDSLQRVRGYSRSTRLVTRTGMGESRLETIELAHAEQPQSKQYVGALSSSERIERAEMRMDEDGHISGYLSATRTRGEGEVIDLPGGKRFRPASPRILFETGISFGESPMFESQAIVGLARIRRVLVRWFRRHGCRAEIVLEDPRGESLSNAVFRFGGTVSRLDHRGTQIMWVLERGFYAVSIEGIGDTNVASPVGWLHIAHIPGTVKATFTVDKPNP